MYEVSNYIDSNAVNMAELLSLAIKKFTKQKTIIFIEPDRSTFSLLRHGLTKNYNIIILTAQSGLRVIPASILEAVKISIQVDTASYRDIMQLIKKMGRTCSIDAVIPGFEYFVPIASLICEYLGLPCISSTAVMQFRRKDYMRVKLKRAGIPVPRFYIVHSNHDLESAIHSLGFPLVCKPVDAAGSVNVKKADHMQDAMQAALRILEGSDILWGHQLSTSVLLEEYIEGKEYSIEGVVQNKQILHFSITEKFVADQSEFIEIGHIVNPPLSQLLKQSIESYVEEVIYSLEADNCPFHAEIRIDRDGQPILMEIAARLAGDKIGDLINLARDINYYDYVYAVYLGEPVNTQAMDNACAGIRFFYRPEVEHYSNIEGISAVKHYPIEEMHFYYQPGINIPEFPKPLRRLGHVMIKSENYYGLSNMLELIDQKIFFH